jgi:NDP-sugar pyrophosphorylase family protein
MKAVILAGGKGTRLRPYTAVIPKPLMPVGDVPILEVLIRQLKCAGCTEVILAVGHLAELIRAFFGTGERWGLKIRYSFEAEPRGTAGPIACVDGLDDDFLVMNGDILTSFDFADFYAAHKQSGVLVTVGMTNRSVPINLGVIHAGADGVIDDYIEKPTLNYEVSVGVYAFSPRAVELIPKEQPFDLPDLVKLLIRQKLPVRGHRLKGLWLDIGNPDDYERAVEMFATDRGAFLPS